MNSFKTGLALGTTAIGEEAVQMPLVTKITTVPIGPILNADQVRPKVWLTRGIAELRTSPLLNRRSRPSDEEMPMESSNEINFT